MPKSTSASNSTKAPVSKSPKAAPKPPRPARGAIPLPEADLFGNKLSNGAGALTLPLELIEPDPNQARWVLPPDIRVKFIAGELTALAALKQWQKQVDRQKAHAGKSASGELPEARKLDEITALANSIRAGGQVNPITVVRQGERWRIETGERRFWAHVWLVAMENDQAAALVPATVQPTIDPFRQAVENLHAAPLNAIGLAREVARLLLASSANPAPGQDSGSVLDLDVYRQLATQRVPPGGWRRIEEAMGKTADHLARYLRLLLLPDEALFIADRNDLSEKHLRPITEIQEPPVQIRVVKFTAELRLSSADVEWLCRQPDLEAAEKELRARLADQEAEKTPRARFAPERVLYNRVVSFGRFVESVRRGGKQPAQALAEQFMENKGDVAESELQGLIGVLEDAMTEIKRTKTAQGNESGEAEANPAPGQDSEA
jgi:ParB-like chromosome segregation protein Spo0J